MQGFLFFFYNVLSPAHFIDLSVQAKKGQYRATVAGDLFLLLFSRMGSYLGPLLAESESASIVLCCLLGDKLGSISITGST